MKKLLILLLTLSFFTVNEELKLLIEQKIAETKEVKGK